MLTRPLCLTPQLVHTCILLAYIAALPACASQDHQAINHEGHTAQQNAVVDQHTTPPTSGVSVSDIDKRIFVVFQAKDNAYWLGSDGQGVYRCDGKSIIQFTTAHGLAGNRVRSIQQDRSGAILISSDGGVSRFDGQTLRVLNAVNKDPTLGLWKLQPDDLWMTGWQDEGVMYRYDGTDLHRLAFPKVKPGEDHIANFPRAQFPSMTFSPYDIYTTFTDSNGHLWFGSCCLGVCRYDGTSFEWAAKTEVGFPSDDSFGVRSIIQDKDGKVWFSTTINRFDIDANNSSNPSVNKLGLQKEAGILGTNNRPVYFLSSVKDKNGDLWLATYNDGIWRYDGSTMTHYPIKIGTEIVNVFTIYRDQQDNLWLGTHENGVYKFNGESFEKFTF